MPLQHRIKPDLKRIGVLFEPGNVNVPIFERDVLAATGALGLEVVNANASSAKDLQDAMASLASRRVEFVVISQTTLFNSQRKGIAELQLKFGLPCIGPYPEMARDGMLVAYGSDLRAHFRRAAFFADRILDGQAVSELPIEFANRFTLALNLKTARTLGVAIPQAVQVAADDVVE